MQIFPNIVSPLVGTAGKILKPWVQYLQQFTQAPPSIMSIGISSSPFTYTAVEPGFIHVSNGTVSSIVLRRGSVNITVTGVILIPVSIADSVIITFTGSPTLQFIPSYGANTSS